MFYVMDQPDITLEDEVNIWRNYGKDPSREKVKNHVEMSFRERIRMNLIC